MTTGDWIHSATERLAAAGIVAARLEAQVLAAHSLGVERAAVMTHPELPAPSVADALLDRRLAGEPLAYLVGRREFYGRDFLVNPSVLIPRQETETLVEVAIERAPNGARVLDIGTGSGCIAITLKLERPDLTIEAIDISQDALNTAAVNAKRLAADITFCRSDLFSAVSGRFDLIVSNPPYIRNDAILPREIREHEPAVALFAGSDGLIVYERLALETVRFLAPGGCLAIELGDGMTGEVQQAFEAKEWSLLSTRLDLGGTERVLVTSPG